MKSLLLKNGLLFSPKKLGKKDILIVDGKIKQIADSIENISGAEIINADGKIICPAFIDGYQHMSKSLEFAHSENYKNGILTAMLLNGGIKDLNSVKNLFDYTNRLQAAGFDCYCLTGGFAYPPHTLTGNIVSDIENNKKIIGTKTALNSKTLVREGNPNYEQFKQLAQETLAASSKKKTHLHVHLERQTEPNTDNLDWIDMVVKETNVPYSLFKLTHASKFPKKILSYAKKGCVIDFTAGAGDNLGGSFNIIRDAINTKDSEILNNITISSDAFGLLYVEEDGTRVCGEPKSLQDTFRHLVNNLKLNLEDVLPFFTTNVAKSLGIEMSGIKTGESAKLLLLNSDLSLCKVISDCEKPDELIK